ncbi:MAG: hypothetical protein FD138_2890, partial [Planctomycetota bacterium]
MPVDRSPLSQFALPQIQSGDESPHSKLLDRIVHQRHQLSDFGVNPRLI